MQKGLRDWIDMCKEKGWSHREVADAMKKRGYSEKQIGEALALHHGHAGKTQASRARLIVAVLLVLVAITGLFLLLRSFRGVEPYAVDMSSVDSMVDAQWGENLAVPIEQVCSAGEDGWGLYGSCAITKSFSLPNNLQGKQLRMVIEARGTEVILPDWHYVETTEFTGMTAEEFLNRDWKNNPTRVSMRTTLFNSLTNATRERSTNEDDWSGELQPEKLAASWNEEFQHLGEFDPIYPDLILENYTFRGNVLQIRHRKQDLYDSSYPVFRATVNGEPQLVYLTSEDWEEHSLEFQPENGEVSLAIEFLNDFVMPAVKDGEMDYGTIIADKNLYIRKISIIPLEEG